MAPSIQPGLHARRFYGAAIGVAVLYLGLAAGLSLTKPPWTDEAWLANPSLTLIAKGYMGSPVLEPTGNGNRQGVVLSGVRRRTYYAMPLYLLTQAAWLQLFGFGLVVVRASSILWGLVALACWFLMLVKLSGRRNLALLGVAFIAIDYAFLDAASTARMDMMCAALGIAGLTAYLYLRERHLTWAVLGSHALVAASIFTHPNGDLAFAGLVLLTIYYDRRRIALTHVLLAMAPYLAGAAGWGIYVLQSPSDFKAQFAANASGRWGGLLSPISGFHKEIAERFLANFYLPPYATGTSRLRVLIPLTYAFGFIAALMTSRIRRHEGYRLLLGLTAVNFMILSVLQGQKSYYYLVHITPWLAAVLAVWLYWWWHRWTRAWLVLLPLCGFLGLQLGWSFFTIIRNNYQTTYMSAVNGVRAHVRQSTQIMAAAELGFGLGSFDNITDDATLGYSTGLKPDLIVVEQRYYEQSFAGFRRSSPRIYEHISATLSRDYEKIYDDGRFYKIYARR